MHEIRFSDKVMCTTSIIQESDSDRDSERKGQDRQTVRRIDRHFNVSK